jgi:hypothetical protein
MDKRPNESLSDAPIEGRYANYFKVGHNSVEFVLDFGQSYGESDVAQIHSRIVMSPLHSKILWKVLRDSILKYEEQFGVIPERESSL